MHFLKLSMNFILIFIFIAPNARAIYKYSPYLQLELLILYASLVISFFLVYQSQVFKSYFKNYIANYWYIAIILIVVSLIIWFVYPIADGLKLQMRGSDQDDCVILGASRLLELKHPYLETSYFGNPCSPGTGMLLLYAPFVLLNVYPFGAIVGAILTILVIRQFTSSVYLASIFTSLLFGSLFQLEMLVVGSDLFLIGCGLTIACLKISEATSARDFKAMIWLGILVGLLSSTRVNFLVLIPVMSVYVYLHFKSAALVFFAISFSVATIPSAFIYLYNPAVFTPLHLLSKGSFIMAGGLEEIGVVFSIVAFIAGAFFVNKSIKNIPSAVLLSILPMLLVLSFGDLLKRNGDFGVWEGANYLLPILPLLLTILITRTGKPT
jgi:hypothetical protein